MDPDTVEYIKTGLQYLAIFEGIRISMLIGVGYTQALFSKKITSQEELEKIVQEEAEKLGIDDSVRAVLHNSNVGTSRKKDNGTYEVHVGGLMAKRCVIKHELYHIFKGHHDSKFQDSFFLLKALNYTYRQEPQAVAYQAFGWKL